MPRHLTAGEKRAQASGQTAVQRALAHTRPTEPAEPEEPWPPSPAIWRHRCREIRTEIDTAHAATQRPTPTQET